MTTSFIRISFFLFSLFFLASCGNDKVDLTDIAYNPIPYEVTMPPMYPQLENPADNPLTVDGVALGRELFYDPILSVDSTMSCSSCHLQAKAFTDGLAVSKGVDGIAGRRSSMSLVDVGFYYNGLFWDGNAANLEDQALLPVEDPIELHHMWPDVIEKFKLHSDYPELFRKAFGIETDEEITRDLATMALAQFERTLVSSGNSLYDRVERGLAVYETDEQQMGFDIYFDKDVNLPDGQCLHCHGAPLMTDNEYRNNGLDVAPEYSDFPDQGLGAIDGVDINRGKFRTPSLRNIEHTAPYMHDGRFETLEEVLDHYISGGHPSINKDPLLDSIFLDATEKAAVIAFLKTLSDEDFLNNDAYSNPN